MVLDVGTVQWTAKLNVTQFNQQVAEMRKVLQKIDTTIKLDTKKITPPILKTKVAIDKSEFQDALTDIQQQDNNVTLQTDLQQDIEQPEFNSEIQSPAFDFSTIMDQFDLLNKKVISPVVDHKPLDELNKHLDIKQQHWDDLNGHMAKNPLRPNTDIGGANVALQEVDSELSDAMKRFEIPLTLTQEVEVNPLEVVDKEIKSLTQPEAIADIIAELSEIDNLTTETDTKKIKKEKNKEEKNKEDKKILTASLLVPTVVTGVMKKELTGFFNTQHKLSARQMNVIGFFQKAVNSFGLSSDKFAKANRSSLFGSIWKGVTNYVGQSLGEYLILKLGPKLAERGAEFLVGEKAGGLAKKVLPRIAEKGADVLIAEKLPTKQLEGLLLGSFAMGRSLETLTASLAEQNGMFSSFFDTANSHLSKLDSVIFSTYRQVKTAELIHHTLKELKRVLIAGVSRQIGIVIGKTLIGTASKIITSPAKMFSGALSQAGSLFANLTVIPFKKSYDRVRSGQSNDERQIRGSRLGYIAGAVTQGLPFLLGKGKEKVFNFAQNNPLSVFLNTLKQKIFPRNEANTGTQGVTANNSTNPITQFFSKITTKLGQKFTEFKDTIGQIDTKLLSFAEEISNVSFEDLFKEIEKDTPITVEDILQSILSELKEIKTLMGGLGVIGMAGDNNISPNALSQNNIPLATPITARTLGQALIPLVNLLRLQGGRIVNGRKEGRDEGGFKFLATQTQIPELNLNLLNESGKKKKVGELKTDLQSIIDQLIETDQFDKLNEIAEFMVKNWEKLSVNEHKNYAPDVSGGMTSTRLNSSNIDSQALEDSAEATSEKWGDTGEDIVATLNRLVGVSKRVGYDVQRNISEGSPGTTERIRKHWLKTADYLIKQMVRLVAPSKKVGEFLATSFSSAFVNIGKVVTDIESKLKGLKLGSLFESGKSFVGNIGETVGDKANEIRNNIGGKATAIKENITGKIELPDLGTIKEDVNTQLDNLKSFDINSILGDSIKQLGVKIKELFSGLSVAIGNIKYKEPLAVIQKTLYTFYGYIITQIKLFKTAFDSFSNVLGKSLTQNAITITENIVEFQSLISINIVDLFRNINNILKKITTPLTDIIAIADEIYSNLIDIKAKMVALATKMSTFDFSFDNIIETLAKSLNVAFEDSDKSWAKIVKLLTKSAYVFIKQGALLLGPVLFAVIKEVAETLKDTIQQEIQSFNEKFQIMDKINSNPLIITLIKNINRTMLFLNKSIVNIRSGIESSTTLFYGIFALVEDKVKLTKDVINKSLQSLIDTFNNLKEKISSIPFLKSKNILNETENNEIIKPSLNLKEDSTDTIKDQASKNDGRQEEIYFKRLFIALNKAILDINKKGRNNVAKIADVPLTSTQSNNDLLPLLIDKIELDPSALKTVIAEIEASWDEISLSGDKNPFTELHSEIDTIDDRWGETGNYFKKVVRDMSKTSKTEGYKILHNLAEGSPGLTQDIRNRWKETTKAVGISMQSMTTESAKSFQTLTDVMNGVKITGLDFGNDLASNLKTKLGSFADAMIERGEIKLFDLLGINLKDTGDVDKAISDLNTKFSKLNTMSATDVNTVINSFSGVLNRRENASFKQVRQEIKEMSAIKQEIATKLATPPSFKKQDGSLDKRAIIKYFQDVEKLMSKYRVSLGNVTQNFKVNPNVQKALNTLPVEARRNLHLFIADAKKGFNDFETMADMFQTSMINILNLDSNSLRNLKVPESVIEQIEKLASVGKEARLALDFENFQLPTIEETKQQATRTLVNIYDKKATVDDIQNSRSENVNKKNTFITDIKSVKAKYDRDYKILIAQNKITEAKTLQDGYKSYLQMRAKQLQDLKNVEKKYSKELGDIAILLGDFDTEAQVADYLGGFNTLSEGLDNLADRIQTANEELKQSTIETANTITANLSAYETSTQEILAIETKLQSIEKKKGDIDTKYNTLKNQAKAKEKYDLKEIIKLEQQRLNEIKKLETAEVTLTASLNRQKNIKETSRKKIFEVQQSGSLADINSIYETEVPVVEPETVSGFNKFKMVLTEVKKIAGTVFTSLSNQFDNLKSKYPILQSFENIFKKIGLQIGVLTFLAPIGFNLLGKAITASVQAITQKVQELFRVSFQSALDFESQINQFKFTFGQVKGVEQFKAIREQSDKLGQSVKNSSQQFAQFSLGLQGAGLQDSALSMFEGIQKGLTVRGVGEEATSRALMAFQQIANKGKLSLEELNGQLSESLAGAIPLAAQAMNMDTTQLISDVSSGKILSEEFLPKMTTQMLKQADPYMEGALDTGAVKITQLSNAINDLQVIAGGVMLDFTKPLIEGLTKAIRVITDLGSALGKLAISLSLTFASPLILQGFKAIGLLATKIFTNIKAGILELQWIGLDATLQTEMGLNSLQARGISLMAQLGAGFKGFVGIIKSGLLAIQSAFKAFVPFLAISIWVDNFSNMKTVLDQNAESSKQSAASYERMANALAKLNEEEAKRRGETYNRKDTGNKLPRGFGEDMGQKPDNIGRGTFLGIKTGETSWDEASSIRKAGNMGEEFSVLTAEIDAMMEFIAKKGGLDSYIEQKKKIEDEITFNASIITGLKGNPTIQAIEKSKALKAENRELTKQSTALDKEYMPASTFDDLIDKLTKKKEEADQLVKEGEPTGVAASLSIYYENEIKKLKAITEDMADALKDGNFGLLTLTQSLVKFNAGIEAAKVALQRQITQERQGVIQNQLNTGYSDALSYQRTNAELELSNAQKETKRLQDEYNQSTKLFDETTDKKTTDSLLAIFKELGDAATKLTDVQLQTLIDAEDKTSTDDQKAAITGLRRRYENRNEYENSKLQELTSALALKDLTKQQFIDTRSFLRSLQDLNTTIRDFFRDRTRALYDTRIQLEDASIQNARGNRDLVESYQDLILSLNTQLLTTANEIKRIQSELTRRTAINKLRSGLEFGQKGFLAEFITLMEGIATSETDVKNETLGLEEQRMAIANDMLGIAKQIRSLQEQTFDLERQRTKQQEDLTRQLDDFVTSQNSAWRSIENQTQDMVSEANRMGFNFKGIADSINGINSDYVAIHNNISTLAESIKQSVNEYQTQMNNSGYTGGSSGSSNPPGVFSAYYTPKQPILDKGKPVKDRQTAEDIIDNQTVKNPKLQDDRMQFAMDYLIKEKGLNQLDASAMVGNFMEESRLNPYSEANGNYGLAHWRDDRAKKMPKLTYDLYTDIAKQLDYALEELNGSHKHAYQAMLKAKTLNDKTDKFGRLYEVYQFTPERKARREDNANKANNQYNFNSVPDNTTQAQTTNNKTQSNPSNTNNKTGNIFTQDDKKLLLQMIKDGYLVKHPEKGYTFGNNFQSVKGQLKEDFKVLEKKMTSFDEDIEKILNLKTEKPTTPTTPIINTPPSTPNKEDTPTLKWNTPEEAYKRTIVGKDNKHGSGIINTVKGIFTDKKDKDFYEGISEAIVKGVIQIKTEKGEIVDARWDQNVADSLDTDTKKRIMQVPDDPRWEKIRISAKYNGTLDTFLKNIYDTQEYNNNPFSPYHNYKFDNKQSNLPSSNLIAATFDPSVISDIGGYLPKIEINTEPLKQLQDKGIELNNLPLNGIDFNLPSQDLIAQTVRNLPVLNQSNNSQFKPMLLLDAGHADGKTGTNGTAQGFNLNGKTLEAVALEILTPIIAEQLNQMGVATQVFESNRTNITERSNEFMKMANDLKALALQIHLDVPNGEDGVIRGRDGKNTPLTNALENIYGVNKFDKTRAGLAIPTRGGTLLELAPMTKEVTDMFLRAIRSGDYSEITKWAKQYAVGIRDAVNSLNKATKQNNQQTRQNTQSNWQPVSVVGVTKKEQGRSTGPHTDIRVKTPQGNYVNPTNYVQYFKANDKPLSSYPVPPRGRYGMRTHPVTGEYKMHDGIDYGTPGGSVISTPLRPLGYKWGKYSGGMTEFVAPDGNIIQLLHQADESQQLINQAINNLGEGITQLNQNIATPSLGKLPPINYFNTGQSTVSSLAQSGIGNLPIQTNPTQDNLSQPLGKLEIDYADMEAIMKILHDNQMFSGAGGKELLDKLVGFKLDNNIAEFVETVKQLGFNLDLYKQQKVNLEAQNIQEKYKSTQLENDVKIYDALQSHLDQTKQVQDTYRNLNLQIKDFAINAKGYLTFAEETNRLYTELENKAYDFNKSLFDLKKTIDTILGQTEDLTPDERNKKATENLDLIRASLANGGDPNMSDEVKQKLMVVLQSDLDAIEQIKLIKEILDLNVKLKDVAIEVNKLSIQENRLYQERVEKMKGILDYSKQIAEYENSIEPFDMSGLMGSAILEEKIRQIEQMRAIDELAKKFKESKEWVKELERLRAKLEEINKEKLSDVAFQSTLFYKALGDPLKNAIGDSLDALTGGEKSFNEIAKSFLDSIRKFFLDMAVQMIHKKVMDFAKKTFFKGLLPENIETPKIPGEDEAKETQDVVAAELMTANETLRLILESINRQGGISEIPSDETGITNSLFEANPEDILPNPYLDTSSLSFAEDTDSSITDVFTQAGDTLSERLGSTFTDIDTMLLDTGVALQQGLMSFAGILSGGSASSGGGILNQLIGTGLNMVVGGLGGIMAGGASTASFDLPTDFVAPEAFTGASNFSFASGTTLKGFTEGGMITALDIPNFKEGGEIEKIPQILNFMAGGEIKPKMIPNFKEGGSIGQKIPKIDNFAKGGTVKDKLSSMVNLSLGISKAMKKEGANALPVVVSLNEQILSQKNGDADFFRYLEKSGEWEALKADYKYNRSIPNYLNGGSIGNPSVNTMNRSNSNMVVNNNSYVTVKATDVNSFRKSSSLIAQEQKIAQSKDNRYT